MTREFFVYLSIIAALFLALLCWLISNPAAAQESRPTTPACAPLEEVVAFLEEKYKEKLRWFGNVTGGTRLFIVDSKDGTWTAVQTDGQRACIIFAGEGSTFSLGEPA